MLFSVDHAMQRWSWMQRCWCNTVLGCNAVDHVMYRCVDVIQRWWCNATLMMQRSVHDVILRNIWSTLHYTINATLYDQRCVISSMLHYMINAALFFSNWVLFHEHSQITGLQGKGEGILLTPHYRFHPLHRHLDISPAITAESSPLQIVSSRTRTGNLRFPSASR